MDVIKYLPGKPDARTLVRGHVLNAVHEALEASRQIRLNVTTVADWLPVRARGIATLHTAFPPEIFDMCEQPVQARTVARYQRNGYAIETVLFESLWGWEVNAHLCIPDGPGPWPALVVPLGHGPKTISDHQLPPVVFARNGFIAISFEEPMFGERCCGNDHFDQGVATALTGIWSETFFAMDALRAIDYLATRSDVDMSMGVGMTGVSGGGETTITVATLDARIRCIAPVCCAAAQRDICATALYTNCPETIGPGMIAAGIDEIDKLSFTAPLPCMIVNGELDDLFTPALVEKFVDEVRSTYNLFGHPERLAHFMQPSVAHSYTAVMAEQVAAWMRRWLVDDTTPINRIADPKAVLEPAEVLNCSPNPARNMQTINAERAAKLAATRPAQAASQLREQLTDLLAIGNPQPLSTQIVKEEEGAWFTIQRIAVQTEADLFVPALSLMNVTCSGKNPLLLWIDDRGKWASLKQEMSLLLLGNLYAEKPEHPLHICSLDVRGWGEMAQEPSGHDLTSWGDIHRLLGYLSNGLSRTMSGQRVRDVLATLAFLRSRADVDADRIIIGGHGAGAMIALFAAVLDGRVAGFIGREMLATYQMLTEAAHFSWPHDIFIPKLLTVCDIPDLLQALSCPVLVLSPVDAMRKPVSSVNYPSTATVDVAGQFETLHAWCTQVLHGEKVAAR